MGHALKTYTDWKCFSVNNRQNASLLCQSMPRASSSRCLLAEQKESWVPRTGFCLLEATGLQSSDRLLKAALPSSLWSINAPLVSAEPSVGAEGLLLLVPTAQAEPKPCRYHYIHITCHFCTPPQPRYCMGCENWDSASFHYHLSSWLIMEFY